MAELAFINVVREEDPDVVVREALYDTYDDDHPIEERRGQEYLVLPEWKGTVVFDVELEAIGFKEGAKVQLDVFTAEGYRAFEVVEVPAGGEPPQRFHWKVGPAPLDQLGAITFIAMPTNAKGKVNGPVLARLDV